jgi:hypothetical protein
MVASRASDRSPFAILFCCQYVARTRSASALVIAGGSAAAERDLRVRPFSPFLAVALVLTECGLTVVAGLSAAEMRMVPLLASAANAMATTRMSNATMMISRARRPRRPWSVPYGGGDQAPTSHEGSPSS